MMEKDNTAIEVQDSNQQTNRPSASIVKRGNSKINQIRKSNNNLKRTVRKSNFQEPKILTSYFQQADI